MVKQLKAISSGFSRAFVTIYLVFMPLLRDSKHLIVKSISDDILHFVVVGLF